MLIGKTSSTLSIFCTVLLVLLWAYTAASKLTDLKAFELQMQSQIFAKQYVKIIMWLVLSAEFLALFLLLFRYTNKLGFWVSFMLMLSFTLYIAFALLGFYESRPCSCGGVINQLSWHAHFWFNCFFLLVSFLGIYSRRKSKHIP